MQFRHRVNRPQGFTLIELLVVIAIIAILAAILFPVFAQARERARAITCLSNTKQVGLGVAMYVQDYDETFPIAWGGYGIWTTQVYPYVKNGAVADPAYPADLTSNPNASPYLDMQMQGMWHCPDDSDSGPGSICTLSYASNANLMGAQSSVNNPAFRQPKTLAAINAPADLIAFGESWKPYFAGAGGYNQTPTDLVSLNTNAPQYNDVPLDESSELGNQWYNRDYQCPSNDISDDQIDPTTFAWQCKYLKFRHARNGRGTGFANISFADGHAKAMRFGQISGKNWLPLLPDSIAAHTTYPGPCPPVSGGPVYDLNPALPQ
jgi:prepilin-type N-terminal cleavage/methylation domain-containing protein/prepilin-type processing-associated H-X9-DG protein